MICCFNVSSIDLRSIFSSRINRINISSIYGLFAPNFDIYCCNEELFNNASYGASKSAVDQMTKYYAKLYGPDIRVNSIAPGGILQGHSENFTYKYSKDVALKRMMYPEEIVNSILFLLSDLSSGITGQIIKVDGGYKL